MRKQSEINSHKLERLTDGVRSDIQASPYKSDKGTIKVLIEGVVCNLLWFSFAILWVIFGHRWKRQIR